MTQWQQCDTEAIMGVFGPPRQRLVSGRGCRVTDVEGREPLDMFAGIAVDALGHAHPRTAQGLSDQLRRLTHVSNLVTTDLQAGLAEDLLRLCAAPAGASVLSADPGSEAEEFLARFAEVLGEAPDDHPADAPAAREETP